MPLFKDHTITPRTANNRLKLIAQEIVEFKDVFNFILKMFIYFNNRKVVVANKKCYLNQALPIFERVAI